MTNHAGYLEGTAEGDARDLATDSDADFDHGDDRRRRHRLLGDARPGGDAGDRSV